MGLISRKPDFTCDSLTMEFEQVNEEVEFEHVIEEVEFEQVIDEVEFELVIEKVECVHRNIKMTNLVM